MNRKPYYDFLIVGSGLFGATFAHLAHKAGYRCLVIDRRRHAGGNVYCENVEGINVHRYGAHIFHTSDNELWTFVNGLVPFRHFVNSPMANNGGRIFNLPFNMNTFYQMWGVRTPDEARAMIEAQRDDVRRRMRREGVCSPRNLEEQALLLVGTDIYETLIRGYTQKQWGRPCTELPPSIIRRLPVRLTYDNNYFDDTFQGIPVGGYNRLVGRLLEGVELRLGADFFDDRDYWERQAITLVYTGCIDHFFGYAHGHLQYRTLRFEDSIVDRPDYQGCAVVNYTAADIPYTRIVEHKHFEMSHDAVGKIPHTVITREYPSEWHNGMEPMYPVNDMRNAAVYTRYREQAASCRDMIFGGRLAEYRYYDMAPTMLRAMDEWHAWVAGR